MVTLKDIARNLGLSAMAVSKALHDAPDIGAATKERVRNEARRLGYIPNRAARGLRGGRSGLIGIVLPALNEPVGCNMLWGIEQEAAARGFETLAASSQNLPDLEIAAVQRMFERQVEALFLFSLSRPQHRSPILDAARRYKTPVVFLDHYPADAVHYPGAAWVAADAARGGFLATGHLLSLGHKNILYLSGPPTVSSAAEHFNGYRKALRTSHIEFSEQRVFLAGLDIDSGKHAMAHALTEEAPFSAVVCASDAVAIGARQTLFQQGYRVPDDISIVGFGDGLLAANMGEGLTTIRHPQVDLGKAAFQIWHKARENDAKLESKVLPVELIMRRSTQPPAFILARRKK